MRPVAAICNTLENSTFDGPGGDANASLRAQGQLSSTFLARGSEATLWLKLDQALVDASRTDPSGLPLAIEGVGALAGLAWEPCPIFVGTVIVTVRPDNVGNGALLVRDDGEQVASFPLAVVEATGMELVLDTEKSRLEARLHDDAANVLYAGDIAWTISPTPEEGPRISGNIAYPGFQIAPIEIVVTAKRGDLEASLTLDNRGETVGKWQIVVPE